MRVATLLTAAVHHSVVASVGMYIIFGMPPQTTTMGILLSPVKANVDYVPLSSMLVVFTVAYFVFDFVYIAFIFQDNDKLGVQHKFHHIVCISIGIGALIGGMAMPKLYAIAMSCEFSMIMLNYRNINGKHAWKGPVALCNTVVFFLCYTILRVILFPILIYAHWQLAT